MSSDFFRRQFADGRGRYCLGYKSQVARDLFAVGTQHGDPPKGLTFGLSSEFVNTLEQTPYSNGKLIVVPWMAEEDFDYESTNYDRTTLNADVIDYKISIEEFDAVVNDLKRNEYWIPQYTFPASLSGGMLIVPLVLLAIWLIVLGHGVDHSHPVIFFIIAVTCPALSVANFVAPYFVLQANRRRLVCREESFAQVLAAWNGRVFTDRKVTFKTGKYGCWLEVHFDKEMSALAHFNKALKDRVLDNLQEEYEEAAKEIGINVDGQKVGLGAIGCAKPGYSGKPNSGQNPQGVDYVGDIDESKIGQSIPAKNVRTKRTDADDLEIQHVNLKRPLLANQH